MRRLRREKSRKKLWRLPWQEIFAPVARDFFVADLQGRLGPHVLQGKIFLEIGLVFIILFFVLFFFLGGGGGGGGGCVGAS